MSAGNRTTISERNFVTCALLLALLPSANAQDEGIRCRAKKGRVTVTTAQWQQVRDAFITHDPKKIAPYISDKGITSTAMVAGVPPIEPKVMVHSKFSSKATFLDNVSKTEIDDESLTFTINPDPVFAWLWVSLRPSVTFQNEVRKLTPPRSIHKRSDVWVSRNEHWEGRMRFVCENGWLRVAEIKAFVSRDSGP